MLYMERDVSIQMFDCEEKAKVQIYTGDGKGKSTAAFGLAMRSAGYGNKVIIIQFQKGWHCGEHESAKKLGIKIMLCSEGRRSSPCESPCRLITAAFDILKEGNADVLVLDEVMSAIRQGCISLQEVLSLLEMRPEKTEIVLTGRNAPKELTEKADLITEMKKLKHYYDEGTLARRGIEY